MDEKRHTDVVTDKWSQCQTDRKTDIQKNRQTDRGKHGPVCARTHLNQKKITIIKS